MKIVEVQHDQIAKATGTFLLKVEGQLLISEWPMINIEKKNSELHYIDLINVIMQQ